MLNTGPDKWGAQCWLGWMDGWMDGSPLKEGKVLDDKGNEFSFGNIEFVVPLTG